MTRPPDRSEGRRRGARSRILLNAALATAGAAGLALFGATLVAESVIAASHSGEDLFTHSSARLAAAPPPALPRVILLFGDSGAASPELRRNAAAMAHEKADFAIHAGDVSYHGPIEYGRFRGTVDDLPFPVFAVPGDHDRDADPEMTEFDRSIGGRNRSIDRGDVRVVFLDTSDETVDENVLERLEAELGREGAPRFSIVVTHCPPCEPHRKYPDEMGHGHALKNVAAARKFMSILEEKGVDLLVCGHVHAFSDSMMGATRVVVTGGGGRDVEPGESFHYVRVTLDDPIRVEEVITAAGHDGSSARHLGDSFVVLLLRYGRTAGAGTLAAAALLLVARGVASGIDRRRAALASEREAS